MAGNTNFDVIIIGGSYAGLSAAMALGRSLRTVLIIDSGLPCNRQTPHSHNFITQDGETPAAIVKKAKAQVLRYDTIIFCEDTAVSGERGNDGFIISTSSGKIFHTQKLIFATGVRDIMPDIKGFSECWGISVIHCPYCHGYEVKNEITGVLANADFAYHYAQLISHLTDRLTIFTNGKADFTTEQLAKFKHHQIPVIEKEIAYLQHSQGNIEQIVFQDQSTFALKALYARPAFEQHCKIPELLGCVLNEQGFIKVDMFQKTNIKDVFACGDSTIAMRSVANAVASGTMAGAGVNKEMTEQEF